MGNAGSTTPGPSRAPPGTRGSIVWVSLATSDEIQRTGNAFNHVVVDAEDGEVEAMTLAIEKLTIARDQLQRLQRLSETDAA